MHPHPFYTSIKSKTIFSASLIIGFIIEFWFLQRYAPSSTEINLLNAASIVLSWGMVGYINWYLSDWLRVWQAKTIWIVVSMSVIISCWFLLFWLTNVLDKTSLMQQLPFHWMAGVLCYFILFLQYEKYEISQHSSENDIAAIESDEEGEESLREIQPPASSTQESHLQHISVKDSSRIHVIPIEEIYYIEACGDYVTLFTASGQYVKEQTMKYFEANLPSHLFVRIHRSYILHIHQILRIELFGKESYQVKLKNGSSLRVSVSGYKQLRKKLNL